IGPDPRNFNQRVSLGRNDLLIRTFPNIIFGFPCPHAEAVIYYVFVILYPQMRSNYLASSSQRYFSNDALVRYTESI
ncbi:hypothetical protein QU896_11600, partial [Citrobacter freundii]